MARLAAPLVGRDEELAVVAAALATDGTGCVILAGPPGVGKTRLAREALDTAALAGARTEWVGASQSASTFPFGAVAHLVPDVGPDTELFGVVQAARRALAARRGDGRLVVGVDDAHLLDDASAALVHHLVMSGTASVVATMRDRHAAPDAITALWKDGHAERIEVGELDRERADELVATTLGGPVDGLTRQRLWALTTGNPLYLRELLDGLVAAGRLATDRGIWRWQGDDTTAPRLFELIGSRLENLPDAVRGAVELVAFGEPLEATLLERAGSSVADVEAAERAGVLRGALAGRRLVVRLEHPLVGEVVRARVPALRARAVHRSLVSALESLGARRKEDALRLAAWHLAAGELPEPALAVEASRRAARGHDHQLAEQLALAARDAGGGSLAQLRLGETLVGQGRGEEAEAELAALPADAPAEVATPAATIRALNLHFGLGRPDRAHEVLAAAVAAAGPAAQGPLAALQAKFHFYAGRCVEAVAVAAPLVEDPDSAPETVLSALSTCGPAWTVLGRHDAAVTAGRPWCHDDDWTVEHDEVAAGVCAGLLWTARLEEAALVADEAYRRDASLRFRLGLMVWSGWRSEIARARGDLREALRQAREAAALGRAAVREMPHRAFAVPAILGAYARVAAQCGNALEAENAIADADALTAGHTRGIAEFGGAVRGWVAAGRGDLGLALDLARRAADATTERDQHGWEASALHDVVRLGGARHAVERLAAIAPKVDGVLVPIYVAHARAAAGGDGPALDEVGASFSRLEHHLLAAEASAQAARAHRAAGDQRRAAASTQRTRQLLARCTDARTPALTGLTAGPELTRREIEIAQLAAAGHTSRAIADRLVISKRTVDNTLGQAYSKLGIRGRDELSDVLYPGGDPEGDGVAGLGG